MDKFMRRRLVEENITTGKRLRKKIDDYKKAKGLKTDKVFLEDLNDWLLVSNTNNKYGKPKEEGDILEIRQKDLSRWLKEKDAVQMEDRKIRMFAEFLNCDFEFLNCTQAVERRSETPEDYNPKRYEDLLEDLERIERFTHFLLDYNVEIIPTKYAKDTTTIKVLEGRNVYEYEIDINRKAISYEIYCPEHDSVQVSRSQLDKFTDDLIKHAKWLIYEIKIDNNSQQQTDIIEDQKEGGQGRQQMPKKRTNKNRSDKDLTMKGGQQNE